MPSSKTFAVAAVAGVASAGNIANANVNAAIQGCVSTCQPILTVSSQCGFPVPADPATALSFGSSNWVAGTGNTNGWTTGTGNTIGNTNGNTNGWTAGTGANGWSWPAGGFGGLSGLGGAGNWGGFGGFGNGQGGWGGWKRDTQDTAGQSPANNNNWLSGNWGSTWTNNINCVCNSQQFDVFNVGSQCLQCVNTALGASSGNPWLNQMALSCGFGTAVGDVSQFWPYVPKAKRHEGEPEDPNTVATAATLAAEAPAAATEAASAEPEVDGTASPQRLSIKGYSGNGWGNSGNGFGGLPVGVTPVNGGSTSGGSGGVNAGGSNGGGNGVNGNSQPVYFAGAPKTSVQGIFAMSVAGTVVLAFGRFLF